MRPGTTTRVGLPPLVTQQHRCHVRRSLAEISTFQVYDLQEKRKYSIGFWNFVQYDASWQRPQSGSKSGGRESGRRNFRSQPKKIRFSGKISDFPAKNSDDLFLVVNSKNCLFSQNIHIFTFYTQALQLLPNFSLFLVKKTKGRRFITQGRMHKDAHSE